jgi:hypothetical protein
MSTFLELAQATKVESGLTGGGPTTVVNASDDDRRFFNWVAWAWRDLELLHESWEWRRGMASALTTIGVVSPTAPVNGFGLTDWASWMTPTNKYKPTAYRVSDGIGNEMALTYLDYDSFRAKFLVGAQTPGGLQYWSIAPSGDFLVGPFPDSQHFVRSDYIKDHVPLTVDTQPPLMPARFHQLLVWLALKQYGGYDAASEIYQRATENASGFMSALSQAQLPKMRWGGKPLS